MVVTVIERNPMCRTHCRNLYDRKVLLLQCLEYQNEKDVKNGQHKLQMIVIDTQGNPV